MKAMIRLIIYAGEDDWLNETLKQSVHGVYACKKGLIYPIELKGDVSQMLITIAETLKKGEEVYLNATRSEDKKAYTGAGSSGKRSGSN